MTCSSQLARSFFADELHTSHPSTALNRFVPVRETPFDYPNVEPKQAHWELLMYLFNRPQFLQDKQSLDGLVPQTQQ